MKKGQIRCTSCRNECMLEVEAKDGRLVSVTGNGCRRGLVTAERKLPLLYREKPSDGVVQLRCTSCRNECNLTVEMESGKVKSVTGNGCRRGLVTVERKLQQEDENSNAC